MIINKLEPDNYTILKDIVYNLDTGLNRIRELYFNNNNRKFEFNGIVVEYNDFVNKFTYSLNILENIFVNFKHKGVSERKIKILDQWLKVLEENLHRILLDDYSNSLVDNFAYNYFAILSNFFDNLKIGNIPLNTPEENIFNEFDGNFLSDYNFLYFINLINDIFLYFNGRRIDGSRDINHQISVLKKQVEDLNNRLLIDSETFKIKFDDFLSDEREHLNKKIVDILVEGKEKISEIQSPYENNLKKEISDLYEVFNQSKDELTQLLGNLDDYKSILSNKTQDEISKHYSKKANSEKITYWIATVVSIVIIIIAIVAAWTGLDTYYKNYVSVSICQFEVDYQSCLDKIYAVREASKSYAVFYLSMRLVFSLLLFLTVIYTSRIAIRAYNHWRHSENMHLKLASLNPFIGNLDKQKRDEIHIGLVPDYFGKDAGVVDNSNDKFKDLPANVSAVAMKAIEQISGNGNSSGTEKNTNNQSTGTQ